MFCCHATACKVQLVVCWSSIPNVFGLITGLGRGILCGERRLSCLIKMPVTYVEQFSTCYSAQEPSEDNWLQLNHNVNKQIYHRSSEQEKVLICHFILFSKFWLPVPNVEALYTGAVNNFKWYLSQTVYLLRFTRSLCCFAVNLMYSRC